VQKSVAFAASVWLLAGSDVFVLVTRFCSYRLYEHDSLPIIGTASSQCFNNLLYSEFPYSGRL
jgi:hypothetical protein